MWLEEEGTREEASCGGGHQPWDFDDLSMIREKFENKLGTFGQRKIRMRMLSYH